MTSRWELSGRSRKLQRLSAVVRTFDTEADAERARDILRHYGAARNLRIVEVPGDD